MVKIRLTENEFLLACHVACERRKVCIARNMGPKYGVSFRNMSWDTEILGCFGEIALAKYLNVYWSGVVDMSADVGGCIDVRTCIRADGNCDLILHDSDDNGRPFVSAHVIIATVELRGWVLAQDGKQKKYWRDPGTGRPAYFVPPIAFRPMEDLRRWLGRGAETAAAE